MGRGERVGGWEGVRSPVCVCVWSVCVGVAVRGVWSPGQVEEHVGGLEATGEGMCVEWLKGRGRVAVDG